MLATVRIGAIHSVVFAGFGARALGGSHHASGSRFVFTADVTYRKGKDVALKPIVDDALRLRARRQAGASRPPSSASVVLERAGAAAALRRRAI